MPHTTLHKVLVPGTNRPKELSDIILFNSKKYWVTTKDSGSGGIRTHASEETGALNQRLRPLGHAT